MVNERNSPRMRVALASYDVRELRVKENYLTERAACSVCKSFQSGQKLLEELEARDCYDVIVLDDQMEDMTALEFIAAIQRRRLPGKPFLILFNNWSPGESAGLRLHSEGNCYIIRQNSLNAITEQLQFLSQLTDDQLEGLCQRLYAEWGARQPDVSCDYLTSALRIVLSTDHRLAIRKEILQQVGERYNVSISAVDSGIRRMLDGLDEQNLPAWRAFKQESGFETEKLTTGKFIYAVKAHILRRYAQTE